MLISVLKSFLKLSPPPTLALSRFASLMSISSAIESCNRQQKVDSQVTVKADVVRG